ncbi:MAG: protein-L-isoaspartate O-methyltransferase [Alphaproteobacteria bacterium]|nr:protein-L-isoaspartate O-methyltransferase [Alphaproteobacteria bacterium]
MSEAARLHMIDGQLRPNDITDPGILSAFTAVARDSFVPRAAQAIAYADLSVEVAPGRFLMEPRTLGKLFQFAQIGPEDRILDVGCATGYSAAVLARLGGKVVALEQDADLLRTASEKLATTSVVLVQGALVEGARAEGPFDVIIIEGAVEQVPETLLAQLAEGGRLLAIVTKAGAGEHVTGHAVLYLKQHGSVGRRDLFDAAAPALAGFKKMMGFAF